MKEMLKKVLANSVVHKVMTVFLYPTRPVMVPILTYVDKKMYEKKMANTPPEPPKPWEKLMPPLR